MDAWINNIVECMFRYIGQTVTIFTTSGGLSGSPNSYKVFELSPKINPEFAGFFVENNLPNYAAESSLLFGFTKTVVA